MVNDSMAKEPCLSSAGDGKRKSDYTGPVKSFR